MLKAITIILLLASAIFAQEQRGMKFQGIFNQRVEHGMFWERYSPGSPNILASDFAWEAWVKIAPENGNGKVLSGGYGGFHSILMGFTDDGVQGFRFTGNFAALPTGVCTTGTDIFSFSTDRIWNANVWYHIAVASRNHILTIYQNGEVVQTQPWIGVRVSSACEYIDQSAGYLYVGGSDHLNFTGEISQVRGWEGYSPYNGRFAPQPDFTASMDEHQSQFLAKYRPRKLAIEDLSLGYNGNKHQGILNPTRNLAWK